MPRVMVMELIQRRDVGRQQCAFRNMLRSKERTQPIAFIFKYSLITNHNGTIASAELLRSVGGELLRRHCEDLMTLFCNFVELLNINT